MTAQEAMFHGDQARDKATNAAQHNEPENEQAESIESNGRCSISYTKTRRLPYGATVKRGMRKMHSMRQQNTTAV